MIAPTQLTGIWSSSVHANHADDRDARIAEIEALRKERDALREALKFYADLSIEGPWHLPSDDYGKRARTVLSAYKEAQK